MITKIVRIIYEDSEVFLYTEPEEIYLDHEIDASMFIFYVPYKITQIMQLSIKSTFACV